MSQPDSVSAATAQVVFMPSGRRGRFALGTPVLEAGRSLGVDIDSVCGGRGLCGRCQVELSGADGTADSQAPVSGFSDKEKQYASRRPLPEKRRLSCSTLIGGDLVVDVPAQSQVHRQLVRKGVQAHDIAINPVIRLYFIEVAQPDMHRQSGDLQRVTEALKMQWELDGLTCEPALLGSLQPTLRDGDWQITVAVRDDQRIVAAWPGVKASVLGLAIDIGSTTIAAQLCDLSSGEVLATDGVMNPQIRFGEDLMSRVSWVQMNRDRWHEMTDVVRDAICQLITEVSLQAATPSTDILELTVVANPVMHHLFLGISPIELGTAPFALATDQAMEVDANQLGLNANPSARVYALPCVAGHVGADTAGVLLAERPDLAQEVTLVVDVGTNAEIVLGSSQRLLACSSPTGPAFEGAQISSGQRAAPGAIERVRINPANYEPRFKVIGCDLWSDEVGFDEAIASTGISGICGSGIIEAVSQMFMAGVLRADGVIDGSLVEKTDRLIPDGRTFSYSIYGQGEPALLVTQTDVRAIQLAKAALNAGVKLLMQHLEVQKIDKIRLAGAFGSHIDVVHAMVLGMLPDCDVDQVSAAGNAAGTGARVALLDRNSRGLIESIVQRVEKIETAVEPSFQEYFVQAMSIPHLTDPYLALRSAIALPAPSNGANAGTARRRSRRRAKDHK
jgi:uncharacterized 2Fe-2S/4Fe-4S cluster protein (DUF4445 family)